MAVYPTTGEAVDVFPASGGDRFEHREPRVITVGYVGECPKMGRRTYILAVWNEGLRWESPSNSSATDLLVGGGSRLIAGERSHHSRYVLTAKRDHERILGAEAD